MVMDDKTVRYWLRYECGRRTASLIASFVPVSNGNDGLVEVMSLQSIEPFEVDTSPWFRDHLADLGWEPLDGTQPEIIFEFGSTTGVRWRIEPTKFLKLFLELRVQDLGTSSPRFASVWLMGVRPDRQITPIHVLESHVIGELVTFDDVAAIMEPLIESHGWQPVGEWDYTGNDVEYPHLALYERDVVRDPAALAPRPTMWAGVTGWKANW